MPIEWEQPKEVSPAKTSTKKTSIQWEDSPNEGLLAAGISAAKALPQWAASIPGFEAGALVGAATPVPGGALIGGLVGGGLAAWGVGKAEEKALELYDKDFSQKLNKIQEAHPTMSTVGSLASGTPFTGVGIKGVTQLAEHLGTTAPRVTGGAAALGGGIDLGMQAMGDKPIDPMSVGLSAATTPLMLGGTKASETLSKITGKAVEKVFPPKEEPSLPKITETAFKNKENGEITRSGIKHDEPTKEATKSTHEQGFLTQAGEFLSRKEAAKRAKETGQIPEDHKFEFPEEGLHSGDLRAAGDKNFQFTPDYDVSQWQKDLSKPVEETVKEPITTSLAKTTKEGEIVLDDKAIEQDFNHEFDYIFNASSPTGLQKAEVFKQLGITKEQFSQLITSPEDYKVFLRAHEQSHVTNNDRANYPRTEDGKIDLIHPDSIAIEKRATIDAINEVKKLEQTPERYQNQGKQILKTQGLEAAKKFAENYRAKQNIFKEYIAAQNLDLGIPKSRNDLENFLYSLGKNAEADKVENTKDFLEPAHAEGLTTEFNKEFIAHVEEGKPLSSEAQALFDKYQKPVLDKIQMITKEIQAKNWKPPTEFSEDFLGRKIISKQMSLWEKTKSKLLEGDQGGLNLNIEKRPGAAQERGLFVIEFPNGKRQVIQQKPDNIISWVNNKAQPFAPKVEGGLKSGMKLGVGTIKEATQSELEKHSPYRYNKSTLAISIEKLQGLQDFYRSKQLIENIKKSSFWKEIAHKIEPHTEIPEGFRIPKYLDKLPEFAGYAFDRKTSYIIEDFAKNYKPNILTMVSSVLIKNMMLNPLPHMMNEAWHLYNARGLSGWVTPKGIQRFVRTAMPAVRSVMKQDDHFRSLLRDGASLLSAGVRNDPVQKAFLEKGMKEFVDSQEGRSLAAKYGMVPLDLYNAISRKSSTAMWVIRDAMYMQMINEKMAQGMSQKASIEAVESHMPAYKLPTEVMKNRELSEMLQNPNISVFSRYHYGMMKSLTNTAADIAGKRGVQGFKEGVDSAAAIAVALAVFYPLQDMLAQAITGNPEATTRRAGPYHVMHAISDVVKGEKQPYSIMASMFTFNPALLGGAQLLVDRQLYNGQPIFHPQDDPAIIAKDVGKYVLTQMPQVSTTLQVSGEKGGGLGQWAAKQVDIISPTPKQVESQSKIKKREEVAARNRARKRAAQQ